MIIGMWTCPKCERNFKSANQWHSCSNVTIDELFEGKPDELVLAFDRILLGVIDWHPCSVGAAKKAVVFASKKAWLIVKPMSKELDLKFYNDQALESDALKKVVEAYGKFAHHIRIKAEYELTEEVFRLLKIGHQYSLR